MKLGIMQPYLFPYIGYFQLIESCDCFVVYDDVQYIKNGWINRNRILLNGKIHYITLPVLKNGSLLSINQRVFPYDFELHKRSLLSKIEQAYRKAPFFKRVYDMVEECFQSTDSNVAVFVTQTLQRCCEVLGIKTPFVMASALDIDSKLRAEDRVISINKILKADAYINPVGGIELYSREKFAANGIDLRFLRSRLPTYSQFEQNFIPALSILDVMMFNTLDEIRSSLVEYDLVA